MRLFPLLLVIALGGCEEEASIAEVEVVRPTNVFTETRSIEAVELSGATMAVAVRDGLAIIGGAAGLFRLNLDGTTTSIDETPVHGLAALASGDALVANADGLFLYGGDILEAPAFEVSEVKALATRGDAVWLATETEVLAFDQTTLQRLAIPGVERIVASGGSAFVVLDETRVLRDADGSWEALDLASEPAQQLTPTADGLFGIIDGALSKRVSDGDDAAWRPVALGTDDGGEGALQLGVDPTSGALWVLTADALIRVEGDSRTRLLRPDSPDALAVAVDRAGAVWLYGADAVTRLPVEARPDAPTWDTDVEAFSVANCQRCHGDLGTAPPMHTFEHWAARADRIIDRLEAGDMPADRQPLTDGDLDLIRAWRNGGLQR
jgi:hypothetical protein